MHPPRTRRTIALLTSAVILASLTVAIVAAPASAGKPRCGGKVATIVGTNKGEVIRGTRKNDVIVARGGHDRILGRGGRDIICGGPGNDTIAGHRGNDVIYGQAGRDRLFGGFGRDRLYGGPSNDTFDGGPAVDRCFQGSGSGTRVRCELPRIKLLAIAYSDLNGNHIYDAGDVMISQLLDTNGDGIPSAGDTVEMGRYPTSFEASAFADWGIRSHLVASVDVSEPDRIYTRDSTFGAHWWTRRSAGYYDQYVEHYDSLGTVSTFVDREVGDDLSTWASSPSRAAGRLEIATVGTGDDRFIDVEINP
jgi:hypothetical protein